MEVFVWCVNILIQLRVGRGGNSNLSLATLSQTLDPETLYNPNITAERDP